MNKNPFVNALSAAVYIAAIVLLISYSERFMDGRETVLLPMIMLSLFVLSAAIMGFLFVSKPLQLYLDGNKTEAVSFFLKTVGFFAIFAFVFLLIHIFSTGLL